MGGFYEHSINKCKKSIYSTIASKAHVFGYLINFLYSLPIFIT
jgi:hypothetical protein